MDWWVAFAVQGGGLLSRGAIPVRLGIPKASMLSLPLHHHILLAHVAIRFPLVIVFHIDDVESGHCRSILKRMPPLHNLQRLVFSVREHVSLDGL